MSYRIAFGLCLLVVGCDASGGVREAEKSVEVGMATNLMGKIIPKQPHPTDPQCGACSFYMLMDRQVYASLDGVENMPLMDLVLYSSSKQILQRHPGLAPLTYAPGKAVYMVPDGATQDVSYGVLTWTDPRGTRHSQEIPAVYKSEYR